jgi:hypothetical protein
MRGSHIALHHDCSEAKTCANFKVENMDEIAWSDNALRVCGLAFLVGTFSGGLGLTGLMIGDVINVWASEFHHADIHIDVAKAGGIGAGLGFGLAIVIFVGAVIVAARTESGVEKPC